MRDKFWIACSVSLVAFAAQAGDGLTLPAAGAVWPQWQARITVQAAAPSLLQSPALLRGNAGTQAATSGSVLGDYYFGSQGLTQHFRASGGLLFGSAGGARTNFYDNPRGRLSGMAVSLSGTPGLWTGNELGGTSGLVGRTDVDAPWATPYLGLGYSGPLWHSGISLSADLGVVAERIDGSGRNRGIFGTQSLDGAVREMRVSPLLQLGVRYAF